MARNIFSDHYQANKNKWGGFVDVEKIEDSVVDKEESREQDEREVLLHQSLAKLDEEQRELLVLTRFEHLKLVEVKEFVGSITVEATYGGVDASLVEKNVGELNAETDYGQIYSNLDSKYSNGKMDDFHTEVLIKQGVGARYRFESKYRNVYLRKQMN